MLLARYSAELILLVLQVRRQLRAEHIECIHFYI